MPRIHPKANALVLTCEVESATPFT